MKLFGKTFGEYLDFAGGPLLFVLVVGVMRFGFYQAGAQATQVRWISVMAAVVLAVLSLSVSAHTRGFGGYKELLPPILMVSFVVNAVIAAGIFYAMWMGENTIFTLPEYSGGRADGKTPGHALAHLLGGTFAEGLVGWGVGSFVLFGVRLVWPGPRRSSTIESLVILPAALPPPLPVDTPASPVSEQPPTVEQ